MKILRILYLSLILCVTGSGYAQNLIPNYSFEIYDTCPFSAGQIYYAFPWTDPSNASADYFNPCSGPGLSVPSNFAGKESAKAGNAYAGLVMYSEPFGSNVREYIQVQLTDSLSQDSCYKLIFHVSIADQYKYGIKNFAAYFSSTAITTCYPCIMPFTPQVDYQNSSGIGDTAGWYKVEEVFQANGGEKYITIGNFNNDTNTSTFTVNSPAAGISYYYIDSVSLTKVTCPLNIGIEDQEKLTPFHIFPNPSSGDIVFQYALNSADAAEIQLYDIAGRMIRQQPFNTSISRSEVNFNLKTGIYFYQIIVNNTVLQSDRLVIIK